MLDARLAYASEGSISSLDRLHQLLDRRRTAAVACAISAALRRAPAGGSIVDVGNGSLCACIAAGLQPGRPVISLESSATSPAVAITLWRGFISNLEECHGLRIAVVDTTCSDTDALRAALAEAQGEGQGPPRVSMIMAEPYYHCCAGRRWLLAPLASVSTPRLRRQLLNPNPARIALKLLILLTDPWVL